MFAELVCGPPGSGKSTYCEGKRQFLSVYDPCRPVIIFNLDPANDGIFPYPCDINICELVSLKETMETTQLGPNGSYLYCSDFIGENLDWVRAEVEKYAIAKQHELSMQYPVSQGYPSRAPYLIIDCPGQVEFYLYSEPMLKLIKLLQKDLQCDLCVVHLTDAGVATRDVPTYVATCLLSLSVMMDMELPHVNVLTKWDTVEPIVPPPTRRRKGKRKGSESSSSSSSEEEPEGLDETREKRKYPPKTRYSSDDDDDDGDSSSSGGVEYDVIGDENEYFLQPTDLFNNHLTRMWRLKDNRKLKEEELLWKRRERALEAKEGKNQGPSTAPTSSEKENAQNSNSEEKGDTAKQQNGSTTDAEEGKETKKDATIIRRAPHFRSSRLFKLSAQIASVVEGYGLVSFEPLAIQDQQMMVKLTQKIDNAMGNLF